jgi:hypothetical protein
MVGEPAARLELTWLGTAGFRLAYQDTVVWIDPYVTRLSLRDLLARRAVPASQPAIAAWIDRADAVLVGHTHFDHALDVPAIARRFGCKVYGSTSLAHLMKLHDLTPQAVVVAPHRDYEVGPFRFALRAEPALQAPARAGGSVRRRADLRSRRRAVAAALSLRAGVGHPRRGRRHPDLDAGGRRWWATGAWSADVTTVRQRRRGSAATARWRASTVGPEFVDSVLHGGSHAIRCDAAAVCDDARA